MKTLLIVLALLSAEPVFACANNLQCGYGQVCAKRSGQLYGICVQPTNQYGTPIIQAQGYRPVEVKSCTSDYQCGYNHTCVKQKYEYKGICLRN